MQINGEGMYEGRKGFTKVTLKACSYRGPIISANDQLLISLILYLWPIPMACHWLCLYLYVLQRYSLLTVNNSNCQDKPIRQYSQSWVYSCSSAFCKYDLPTPPLRPYIFSIGDARVTVMYVHRYHVDNYQQVWIGYPRFWHFARLLASAYARESITGPNTHTHPTHTSRCRRLFRAEMWRNLAFWRHLSARKQAGKRPGSGNLPGSENLGRLLPVPLDAGVRRQPGRPFQVSHFICFRRPPGRQQNHRFTGITRAR